MFIVIVNWFIHCKIHCKIPPATSFRRLHQTIPVLFNGGQPETKGVTIVITGSLSMAFYEGRRAEVLQT